MFTVVAIGLFYLILFWHRLILKAEIPFDGNFLRHIYPSWSIGKHLLQSGFFFLWDPYRNMGMPFLADPQNQALYPFRFLSPYLDIVSYVRLFILFHSFLAALPMFLLVRRWAGQLPALLATIVISFNGFFFARVTLLHHFAALAWIPAVIFFLWNERPIALGLSLCMQWLAGHPPIFFISSLGLLVLCLAHKERRRSSVCLIQGFCLAGGLAAIQILPFLEMMRESARPLVLAEGLALEYSLQPLELLRPLFFPSFFLTKLTSVSNSDPAIIGFYTGPILSLLFIWGWIKGGRREKILGVGVVASLLLSLGRNTFFYSRIPGIMFFRFPGNWLALAIPFLAIVAANGLASIKNSVIKAILIGAVAIDLLIYAFPPHTAWADGSIIVNGPQAVSELGPLPNDNRIFHTAPIKETVHNWKIHSKEDWLVLFRYLVPSIGAGQQIFEADSFHQLPSLRHVHFISRLNSAPLDSPLYDDARIEKIISVSKSGLMKPIPGSGDRIIFENPNPKPRAFMDSAQAVKILEDQPGDVRLESQGPGQVILSESYFPGWKVFLDGKLISTEIFEGNFLAASIPEGPHRIQFRYRPTSFKIGEAISICTIAFLCFMGFWQRRKAKI